MPAPNTGAIESQHGQAEIAIASTKGEVRPSPPAGNTAGEGIAFGVGCFHFRFNKTPPYTFSLSDYADDLRSALQNIANINNIHLNIDPDDNPVLGRVATEVPSLADGDGYFPPLSSCSISFEVYIPFRIQEQLALRGISDETGTERFRVHIGYSYHAPVCFVELVAPAGDVRPSSAVQIVREYLKGELPKHSKTISFEALGPSPFHADFYLERVPSLEDADVIFFQVDALRVRGYHKIVFRYAAEEFKSIAAAAQFLFYELREELGLFYGIRMAESHSINAWEQIQDQVGELVDAAPRDGLWARFRRSGTRSRQLYNLRMALTSFEASQVFDGQSLRSYVRQLYATDEDAYLETYLQEALNDRARFPVDSVKSLLGFIEERRSKAVELLVILTAAIVGGVAGSIVTILSS